MRISFRCEHLCWQQTPYYCQLHPNQSQTDNRLIADWLSFTVTFPPRPCTTVTLKMTANSKQSPSLKQPFQTNHFKGNAVPSSFHTIAIIVFVLWSLTTWFFFYQWDVSISLLQCLLKYFKTYDNTAKFQGQDDQSAITLRQNFTCVNISYTHHQNITSCKISKSICWSNLTDV